MRFLCHFITTFFLALGMGTTTSRAQMSAFECSEAREIALADGEALLAKVQSAYAGVEALHGGFRQDSYVAALDENETSMGEMWFGKPGKMRWVYSQPRPQTVVINNGTLWLYQPDKQQVLIDDIGQVFLSSLPVSFMMGLGNVTKDFDLKGACRGDQGTIVRLVPHKTPEKGHGADSQNDTLEGFDLLVDAEQSLPKGAKISSLGGNVTAIIFKGLKSQGVPADPARFVLEYPKGVDVMDKRVAP